MLVKFSARISQLALLLQHQLPYSMAYELLKPIYNKETDTWHGTNSAYDLQKSVSGLSKQVANLNETVDLITQALSGNTGSQSPATPINPDGKEVLANV